MKQLYWNICGEGDRDLVLLHGWGLNAEVWHCIIDRLSPHFRLHLVDLPGYGRSKDFGAMSLSDMAAIVLQQAPEQALWLGWSMGGLVASQIALSHPERVNGLITVSSSPCFTAHDEWRVSDRKCWQASSSNLARISSVRLSAFWRCKRWALKVRGRMPAY